jgi:hypothetical protein
MGLGPPTIELYRQLKLSGALEGITEVMELGSQDFWCPQRNLVIALFEAFGRKIQNPALLNTTNTNQQPARLLYEGLGIKYFCTDVDGRDYTIVLDLNFDPVPQDHNGRYGLVTNHGTAEHVFNQYNVFKAMHDFARPGAVLIHGMPFIVFQDHGFFNYQPEFFEALARCNSYETLGMWVSLDSQLASLIPWEVRLLDFVTFSMKTTHLLVVVQRKVYDTEFRVPRPDASNYRILDEIRSRHATVIDGEAMDDKRVKFLTKESILAKEYISQIMGLNNWVDAYKGQIDGLRHELAVAKHQLDQFRQSPRPSSKSQSTISDDIGSLADVRAGLIAVELARRIRGRVSRLFGRSERSR